MNAPDPMIFVPPTVSAPNDGLEAEARVNLRLIGWTLGLIVACGGICWFLRSQFLHLNTSVSLEKARDAEARGDTDGALELYGQYLQVSQVAKGRQPEDQQRRAELLGRMADLLRAKPVNAATIRRIYQTYEECLRLDRDQPARRRDFVKWLMQMNRFEDALSHLKVLQESAKPGNEAGEVAFLSAVCLESTERYAESQSAFLESIRQCPRQTVAYTGLAQLWALHLNDLDPLQPTEVPDGAEWQSVMTVVRPDKSGEPRNAWRAAEGVLEAMLANGPEPEGVIDAAQFLSSQEYDLDRVPAGTIGTDALVRAALSPGGRLRVSTEGPQPVLPQIDRWAPRAPSFADLDRNGSVTPEELRRRFERGTTLSRIDWAERLLLEATASADPPQRVAMQLMLARLYRAKAEISQFAQPGEFARCVRQAREALNVAVDGDDAENIDVLMARLDLDLMDQPGNSRSENPLARLQRTERDVTNVLERLHQFRAAGDAAASEDWTVGSRLPDLRRLEIELRFRLAGLLLSQSAVAEAEGAEALLERVDGEVARLQQLGAAAPFIEYIGLQQRVARREYATARDEAAKLQGALRAGSPLSRQVTLLAVQCEEHAGTPNARLSLLRQHLKNDASWIAGRQTLAEGLLALGRLEEAIAEYRPIAALPVPGTRLLELLLVQAGQLPPRQRTWEEAETLLKFLQEHSAETARIALLGVELRTLEAATLHSLQRETRDAKLERQACEHLAQAEQLLKAVRAAQPEAVAVRTAEASFALRRFDRTAAERIAQTEALIASARQELGERLEFDLLECSVIVERSGKEGLEQLRELTESRKSWPPESRARLLAGLARLATQAGDLQAGLKFWRQAADLEPQNLESRLAIARMLLMFEPLDQETWETTLHEIARIERTDDGSVACLRVERILRNGVDAAGREEQLSTARALLKTVELSRPDWSAIPRLQGFIADLLGERETAIELYRKALSLGDRSPDVIQRVVVDYYRRREYKEADSLLLQVGGENANLLNGDLARLSWRVAWNRQQYDQALGAIEKLAESSQSGEDYIALALLQFARGGEGDATERALRKGAFELSPGLPEPWMALVAFLARTRQWEKAESAVAGAREHLPKAPKPTALLVAGSLYELLAASNAPRQKEYAAEATRAYEQALREAPDENSVLSMTSEHFLRIGAPERAQPLLQSLLDPDRNVLPPVRRWARRQMVEIIAAHGNYDDMRRALSLLAVNVDSEEVPNPADLRRQLQLLERLASRNTGAERVAVLRRLQALSAMTPDEHLQLAKLLGAGGDIAAARAEYGKLLEAIPDFTRARAAFAVSLLREAGGDDNSRREAARQIEILQDLEPQSWQTTQARVRLLALTGKREEAAALLTSFLEARLDESAEDPVREVLEQENLPQFLSELHQDPRVQASPPYLAAVLDGVQLLQEGQRDAAVESLLKGAVSPLLTELRYDVVLKAGLLSEELQLPETERWLREYAARSPRSTAPFALAGFLIRRERVAEALDLLSSRWDQLPRSGAGSLIVLAALHLPAGERVILGPWRTRLAAELDQANATDRQILSVQLADLDQLLGSAASAIQAYRETVAANPRDITAWNNLAVLLARHPERPEDLREAERAIGEALRIAGPHPALIDSQAIVYLAQGRAAEALTLLQPLATPQASPTLYLRIAECLQSLGHRDAARQAIAEARRKGFGLEGIPATDRPRVEKLLQEIEASETR